jgi:hypothetical protein
MPVKLFTMPIKNAFEINEAELMLKEVAISLYDVVIMLKEKIRVLRKIDTAKPITLSLRVVRQRRTYREGTYRNLFSIRQRRG